MVIFRPLEDDQKVLVTININFEKAFYDKSARSNVEWISSLDLDEISSSFRNLSFERI